jgi:formylglycine-generating enzyme required for sulfatase activity
MSRGPFLLVLAIGLFSTVLGAVAQQRGFGAGQRFALLIANSAYPEASAPLVHPPKNVRALGQELKSAGFEVDVKENLDKQGLQRTVEAFTQKLRPGSAALFFFSGYGLQVNRQTFIMPINAQVWTERDVVRDGFSIEAVLSDFHARGAMVKLLVVDASRRNPFERRFRAAPSGLALIEAPSGSLVISAAAPGRVIDDESESSIFVGELVKEMRAPGLTADEIFRRTRNGVARLSKGEQVPWVSSSLVDEFYFLQPSGRKPTNPPTVEQGSQPRPQPEPPRVTQSPPQPAPPQPPRPAQTPPPEPQRQATAPPRVDAPRSVIKAGDVLRDCSECPELVVVPAGEFEMGSNDFDFEKPIHLVTIVRTFAIGRREVTFEEWDQCVAAGGCKHRPDDRGQGRGERPVTDVSWRDAVTYAGWISQKTGQKYRLPSEAEWEYAARGGTKTTFWWGRDVGTRFANCRDCGGISGQAVAAGSFSANPFGLFDTAGNAAEWVEDCWNDSYRGAPRDATAWTSGQCGQRVLRGGSFDSQARYLRSASRFRYDMDVRYYANGFRIVRDLP